MKNLSEKLSQLNVWSFLLFQSPPMQFNFISLLGIMNIFGNNKKNNYKILYKQFGIE